MNPQNEKISKNNFFKSYFRLSFLIVIFVFLLFVPFLVNADIDPCTEASEELGADYHKAGNENLFQYGGNSIMDCPGPPTFGGTENYELRGGCVDKCGTPPVSDDSIECPYCFTTVDPRDNTISHYCCIINNESDITSTTPKFKYYKYSSSPPIFPPLPLEEEGPAEKLCCCYNIGISGKESCGFITKAGCPKDAQEIPSNDKRCYAEPPNLKLQIPIGELEVAKTIGEYIGALFKWLIGALGVLAVVMIMVAGIQWIFAAGSAPKIEEARKKIGNAILGILLVSFTVIILGTINPALLNLELPPIEKVLRVVQESEDMEEVVIETPDQNFSRGGWTFESSSIENQVKDASEPLRELLVCIREKISFETGIGRISSISDDHGMNKCMGDNYPLCPSNDKFKDRPVQCKKNTCPTNPEPCCWHGENSCHYGGRNCQGKSYAVDFGDADAGTDNLKKLIEAAKACEPKAYLLEEPVGKPTTHLHVSVGAIKDCGCN